MTNAIRLVLAPKTLHLRRLGGGTKPNIFVGLLGFTTFHPTYNYLMTND
ncbi:hypothetical protein [Nostoc sp.]